MKKKENCADWSKYDHLGITDAIKEFTGTTIKLDSPKGSGFKWFVVKHRDVYTQIYTDGTWNAVNPNDIDIMYDNILIKDLAYHKSWDWLMPVVEKIEHMEYNVICSPMSTVEGWHCSIAPYDQRWKGTDDIEETKIEAVYKSVVTTIKQLNTKKS